MKLYLFNVWCDNQEENDEILIEAQTEEEAVNILSDSNIKYDHYSIKKVYSGKKIIR